MIFLIKFKKNDTKVVSYHNNISCKCVYGQYYISRLAHGQYCVSR